MIANVAQAVLFQQFGEGLTDIIRLDNIAHSVYTDEIQKLCIVAITATLSVALLLRFKTLKLSHNKVCLLVKGKGNKERILEITTPADYAPSRKAPKGKNDFLSLNHTGRRISGGLMSCMIDNLQLSIMTR